LSLKIFQSAFANSQKMNKQRILGIIMLLPIMLCTAAVCGTSSAGPPLDGTSINKTVYSDANNWLSLPAQNRHEADVIFFYPTTYSPESPDAPLISTLDDEGMRAGAQHVFRTQATAFETCADIYAPYYQQVNFTAFEGAHEELMEIERGAVERIFGAGLLF